MRKRVLILGAGLSGLVAGEILSKNFEVKIFEKESFLGGLAASFEHDGKKIPRFYHHIIKKNKYTQDYFKRFGGKEKLKWKKIKVAIGVNEKVSIINSFLGPLNFDYLNFYEKIRFGLFGIYSLLFMKPYKIPEEMNAETWLKKYVGKNVTQKVFFHLYSRNKFGIPLNKISAKQFAYRLSEKEIQDKFTFPKQGYQCVIDGLEKAIKNNKGIIKKEAKIKEINVKKKYVIESGKKIKYDILINTIPFEIFINLSKGLPSDLEKNLSKIKYCPGVGFCFGSENFLKKGIYWTNILNERVHIVMQHSDICDVYRDKINWCLRYGESEEDFKLDDEDIQREYLKVIKKYFPKAKIKWIKVFKTKYGEPIYDIDYPKYMPNYKSPVEGLYFAGIQLTYPKIRNMDVALESGIKVARTILKDFLK